MQKEQNRDPRVLLAVASVDLRQTFGVELHRAGFRVSAPSDLDAALTLSTSFDPDIVVVDSRFGSRDGRSVVEVLRSSDAQYVICVTGRGEDAMRISALRHGADDAVSLPVDAEEIAVRCAALLRRPRRMRPQLQPDLADEVMSRLMEFGPLRVDAKRHVILLADSEIAATRLEFALLEQLCLRPTEVITRAELLDAVWGADWGGDRHIVDVHLSNLRRKFERASRTKVIQTVRGVGFCLADDIVGHLLAAGTNSGRTSVDRRLHVVA